MNDPVIIKTDNLSIGYSQQKKVLCVASEIHLSLEKGKLIALVGINGVGKSTLLRTLTGIQKPLTGDVFLHEHPISQVGALSLAREMSLVLTEKLPPSNLTVYDLIALGRQPYTNWIGKLSDYDKTKIDQAVRLTQTEALLHKRHYEISDGQLQIVMIARALAQDTPLIVLDEPTTHLDLQHKVSLFKLLKKLSHEEGKCILFSTHDIEMAIQMSDEMIVMSKGICIQDEPCHLISRGVFNNLFEDQSIVFDATKGKFIIG